MAETFSAAVKNWAEKTEVKQTEVLHLSVRNLTVEIAHNTPVITGNTRNSLAVSTEGPPPLDWARARTGKRFRNEKDAINNAIAGVAVGQKVWIGFRAPWAITLEPKYAIMRLAAQRWAQIVDHAASVLRGR